MKKKNFWKKLILSISSLFVTVTVVTSCSFGFSQKKDEKQNEQSSPGTSSGQTQNQDQKVAASNLPKAKVTRYTDGDTVNIIYDTIEVTAKIRFYGIDTPETLKGSNRNLIAKYENVYAQKAKDYVKDLITKNNHVVYVKKITTDKYNRTVAILYLTDDQTSKSVNELIVENGYGAVRYISLTNKTYKVKDDFQRDFYFRLLNLQEEAKSKSLNIWEHDLKDVYYKYPFNND
ncbi:thermonuclease family protein [Mycoplasmopsis synoviae]|uniref:thermonuclease family protein n=1 Tax=Mycoplasmopsis synoviae TaxID=2109 RepID=UPI003563A315